MLIKISQEQLDLLTEREKDNYIRRLYDVIVRNAPSLSHDNELISRLKEADNFVTSHGFRNKHVITDFLITGAFEPYFYKSEAMENWLLKGPESVESEYIKYQQIRNNLMGRMRGGINE